ncbi:MAG TPA: DUF5671 domain-containing protein [Candidatus Dormibacteraeota bacterium]|nr:DUF5671 domain-containing protein [Candidatus Dormibacteraeota bacterium]
MHAGDREKLAAFIRDAKNKGAGDAFLVDLLKQNGWSERRIYGAFSDYYAQQTGAPVPSRGQGMENARDAFLYLVSFVSLGFWSIALIWLGNIAITRAFPSPTDVESTTSLRYDLAGQLASIIIGFPIFMLVSWILARQTARRPEELDSGVRKWLTYVALVIAAIALLSDAVLFLQSFLTGNLTVRFALQYMVLIVVAGGIFWYYLRSMRAWERRGNDNTFFGAFALTAVIAALAVGFGGVGAPAFERQLRMDEQRVSDMYAIATAINTRGNAPASLAELAPPASRLRDPATGAAFVYARKNAQWYDVCATFDTSNVGQVNGNDPWAHPAGRYCYRLSAATAPNVPSVIPTVP